VGHDNNIIYILEISDLENMIEVTMQDLNKGQNLYLESFSKKRNNVL
jgi:hypothetical protein